MKSAKITKISCRKLKRQASTSIEASSSGELMQILGNVFAGESIVVAFKKTGSSFEVKFENDDDLAFLLLRGI